MLRYKLAGILRTINRLKRMVIGSRSQSGTFRVLLLHDVPPAHLSALADLVDYVKDAHGVLSPEQAAAVLNGTETLPDNGRVPCLFSFDDGFASNAVAATDVLNPRGVRALFFVCPGLMAEETDQHAAIAATIFRGAVAASDLSDDQHLMTMDDLRKLKQAGHAIGAHGMRHQRLSILDADALAVEVLPSGTELAAQVGGPIDWYAYAFGDIDSISKEALAVIAEHHRYCRSGVRGLNSAGTKPLAVRADSIDLAAPLSYTKFILEGGLDDRYGPARDRLDALTP